MNASTRVLTLALSVALVGCAAPSTPNPEHLVTSDAADAAQLSVVYPPDRREGYALIYPGSCERSPFGFAYAEPIYRSIFRGPPDDASSIKVKPLTPITLSYSFSISDTTCRVSGQRMVARGQCSTLHPGVNPKRLKAAMLSTSMPHPPSMLAAPFPDPMAVATGPDPYSAYARLRAQAGVHWLAERQLWAVVSAAAVDAAFQLPAARVRPPAEPVPAFLGGTRAGQVFAALARMTDGATHAAQRARTLALMQRLTADRLAAAVAQSAPANASPSANAWPAQRDAAALNAWIRALPTRTVAAALGFAADQPAAIAEWTGAWVTGLSPLATDAQRLAAITAMDALLALLADAGICSTDDAAAHVALWMQPHEATAGLIGAGLLRLAQDAPLRHAALTGTLPWDRFGAEVLRHDPPIQNTRRTLATHATLEGQALRAGDTLLLALASAARDPAAHDTPDTFRLDRPARTPLTLGAGAHACPGGAAALAIATGCWRHVAQQSSDAGLAGLARGVSWQPSVNARIPVFAASC